MFGRVLFVLNLMQTPGRLVSDVQRRACIDGMSAYSASHPLLI